MSWALEKLPESPSEEGSVDCRRELDSLYPKVLARAKSLVPSSSKNPRPNRQWCEKPVEDADQGVKGASRECPWRVFEYRLSTRLKPKSRRLSKSKRTRDIKSIELSDTQGWVSLLGEPPQQAEEIKSSKGTLCAWINSLRLPREDDQQDAKPSEFYREAN